MAIITAERFKEFAPHARADIAVGIVAATAEIEAAAINTPLRMQHFLAQLAHESDQFKTTREYASGSAYEGREDLGNTHPGDGRRFRGRGLIQITGRANARAAGEAMGQPYEEHPELMETFPHALLVSIWFWNSRKLSAKADEDDVVGITKRINGGTNGLADRKKWLAKAKKVFV